MNLRRFLLPWIATLAAALCGAAHATAPQVYEAHVNGVRTELRLLVAGGTLDGQLLEQGVTLALRGTARGPCCKAICTTPPAARH